MSDTRQPWLFEPSPKKTTEPEEIHCELPKKVYRPLAYRMRPHSLDEVVGHENLIGKNAPLRRLIQTNELGSLILYGPPGCGKTSLAEVIANEARAKLIRVNAVTTNLAELRDALSLGKNEYTHGRSVIVLIDEIHRFNKATQDVLLPDLESGEVRLIGLTTYHPGHYLIPALLSRALLFRLEPLPEEAIIKVLERALTDVERGLGKYNLKANSEMLEGLARLGSGDLRRSLGALETIALNHAAFSPETPLTLAHLEAFAKDRHIIHDRTEDEHYNTASAFIKSIRGCDPDAALYWLAKMLVGGEDPRFVARRLVILASEDVGLASPYALPVAMAAFEACERIGPPECEINLAHATCLLALSPKSNSAYMGLKNAKEELKRGTPQSVPLWLRDKSTAISKQLSHGDSYIYSHDCPETISGQEYLENPLSLYKPILSGAEIAMTERLERWREIKAEIKQK
jgi:putative ATPase